ncbi:hypothetical protein ABPG74_003926 [Tetrahymena malaccensis]
MKVITKLEDITRYLKNKDQEEIQKILVVNNGLLFDQDNKLSTFFNFISKVPSNVNDIQIQITNVENHSNSFLEDLKQLLKLNFKNLQLQIDVHNFIQNSQPDIFNEILQFAANIISKGNFYRLKFNVENELMIDINQQIASIKYKQRKQIRLKETIDGFSQLLLALKKDIQIFSFKFILSNIRLTHLQKNELIKSLEDFQTVQNQKLKIYLNDGQEVDYKNILKNNKLLQNGKYKYDILSSNILLTSSYLSDSVKSLQIFKHKQLVLQKQEQNLSLNLNSQLLISNYSKDLEFSINNWNMHKLTEIILNIDQAILQQGTSTALQEFINKQHFIKNLTINYQNNFYSNQIEDIFIILKAIHKLRYLEKIKFEFLSNNYQEFDLQDPFFTSSLQNLKHIDIKFVKGSFKLSKFLSFMRFTPNVKSVLIDLKQTNQKIELKNKQLDICINDSSNELFDYFTEENFKLKKQVSLKIQIIRSSFIQQDNRLPGDKLDIFSANFNQIEIKFQMNSLCFEYKLNAELKRERPFSIYLRDTKIFEKQELKQIFIKIDYFFIQYFQQLYPEQINLDQNQINPEIGQQQNANSLNLNQQINQIDNSQQQIIIDQGEINQQAVQNNQIPEIDENQNLAEDALEEQLPVISKKKQKKKTIEKQDFECPKQFENFFEFIEQIQMYEQCSLDFSSVNSQKFLETFYEKLYLLRKMKNININISNNQLNKQFLQKWKSFFNHFNKAESLALNLSNNNYICNQSALYAFSSLKKCKQNLLQLKIDLSQTSVKKRGLLQLSKYIAKFNQLRVFHLNISNSSNLNILKSQFIQQLFISLNDKNLPNLEELCLKACNSSMLLDQNFYNILATNIPMLSQNLKHLKLNFKKNIALTDICQNKFLASLSKLPKDLVSISLNFQQIQDYTQSQLFTFMKITQILKSFNQLEKLSIKSNKYAQVNMKEYANELLKFLNQINFDIIKKLNIDIYQFSMQICDQQLTLQKRADILFLNQLDAETQHFYKIQISKILFNIPPNIKIIYK